MSAHLLQHGFLVPFKCIIFCLNVLDSCMQFLNKLLLICDDCKLLLVSLWPHREAAASVLLDIIVEIANRTLILQIHRLLLLGNLNRLEIYGC